MNHLIKEGLARASSRLGNEAHGVIKGRIEQPKTRDQLHKLVYDLWGIWIPRKRVCNNGRCNCSPFEAFADAFFAEKEDGTPVDICVWHASRGFGGKSLMLAVLALTEAAVLAAKVNLLGGSGEQAERVLAYMYGEELSGKLWGWHSAPTHLIRGGLDQGMLKKRTGFVHGGYVKALMASSRSVRGPHPERLRLDEVDEMELKLFDDAMGQTMESKERGIRAQTVASSTWHYANGTMTEILNRAKDRGWPVYRWCMHENHEDHGGWLMQKEIDRKKREVTKAMFEIEYELQDPAPQSRAIDPAAVEKMFKTELGQYDGKLDEHIKIPVHLPGNIFAHGADWAKRTDYTVIVTLMELPKPDLSTLTDEERVLEKELNPTRCRLVEFERTGRKPWPFMVGRMETRIKSYKHRKASSYAAHDETGIGDVIGDYIQDDGEMEGLWLTGRLRYDVFSDYIQAIEHGYIEAPRIDWMYREHLHCSLDDLWTADGHPPDSFVAGAVAYHILKNKPKRRVRATWGS